MPAQKGIEIDYNDIISQIEKKIDAVDIGLYRPTLGEYCSAIGTNYFQIYRMRVNGRASKRLLQKLHKAGIVFPKNIMYIILEKYKKELQNRLKNPLHSQNEKILQ